MVPDTFIEYYYGKYKSVDLHQMTKEESRAELVYTLNSLDTDTKCLVVIHGYHGGTVIKNLVKKEFKHPRIAEKITLDAARTIFLIKS
ncbi:MAG: DNA mismatch repair protein MutS [Clostridia bacterium]|nr:DNA mismatch repair protein MutS [Clostridia bacterium]